MQGVVVSPRELYEVLCCSSSEWIWQQSDKRVHPISNFDTAYNLKFRRDRLDKNRRLPTRTFSCSPYRYSGAATPAERKSNTPRVLLPTERKEDGHIPTLVWTCEVQPRVERH